MAVRNSRQRTRMSTADLKSRLPQIEGVFREMTATVPCLRLQKTIGGRFEKARNICIAFRRGYQIS